MSKTTSMSLEELLRAVLPKGKAFEALLLRNVPVETHPLVTAKRNTTEPSPLTVKTQHLFVLFYAGKVIFGLEIYVYLTLQSSVTSPLYDGERTIFISKADTTGYANCAVSYKKVTKVVIQYILSLDPNIYLLDVLPRSRDYSTIDSSLITKKTSPEKALRKLSDRLSKGTQSLEKPLYGAFNRSYHCARHIDTKLCLFTRPASQYLFAESSKNPEKHVVDGEQLLKWWIGILDEILLENFQDGTQAKIRIPGEDSTKVRRYLRNTQYGHWEAGDVFGTDDRDLAAFQIPLFPDDPKTRFLRQLAEENRLFETTSGTYWTELQERQEFKLSVIVSVIGLQGRLNKVSCDLTSSETLLKASSRKQFNCIKNYITGEEYNTVEGAIEAYTNVRDYLAIKLNDKLIKILGAYTPSREPKRVGHVEVATTLQIRKKPKKAIN